MDQSNDQDVTRLRERVSLLEFEISRRDVIDRIRSVIQRLPDNNYEAVLEAISGALTELGVSYEQCAVHVLDRELRTVVQNVKVPAGWIRSTKTTDWQLMDQLQRQPAPVSRPDLTQDDPFGEASWALESTPPIRSIVDAPWSRGTLSVNSTEANAFQPRDIECLAMLAAVLSEAFVRIEDLRTLQEGQEQQREALIREAEHAIRLRVSQMEKAEDLESVTREIETQLGTMDVKFESFSLQIVNQERTDFISTHDIGEFLRGDYQPDHAKKYPWVLDVFRSGKPRYDPCTTGDSPLLPGLSVVDVPFSHGTLAINRQQPNAFTARDIDLLGRFAGILSEGFQSFLDIVERRRAQAVISTTHQLKGAMSR